MQRGQIVDAKSGGLLEAQGVRQPLDGFGRCANPLREAAPRNAHHPVADPNARHTVAQRLHHAGDLAAGNMWQGRFDLIATEGHQGVNIADAAGGDLDQDLAGTRRGFGQLDLLIVFEAGQLLGLDGFHGLSPWRRIC